MEILSRADYAAAEIFHTFLSPSVRPLGGSGAPGGCALGNLGTGQEVHCAAPTRRRTSR